MSDRVRTSIKPIFNDEVEMLRDAIRAIIAHYDEFGPRTRGMDMILNDCRELLEKYR